MIEALSDPSTSAWWVGLPVYVVFLAMLVLVGSASGASPSRIATVAGLAAGWALLAHGVSAVLPVEAMQPLHETVTSGTLKHVVGYSLFQDYLSATVLSAGPTPTLRWWYGWQIAWWGWGLSLLVSTGRALGLPWRHTLLLIAPLALPPWGWHLVMSGTAAAHVLFLQAATAWMVARAHLDRSARGPALVAVVGATVLLAHLRLDPALVVFGAGLPAWLASTERGHWLDEQVAAWLHDHPWRALGVAIAAFAAWALAWHLLLGPNFLASGLQTLSSAAYFLNPLHPGAWTLGPVLLAAVSTVWALLVAFGAVRTLRRPVALAALPVLVVLGWRAYYTAGHGRVFEFDLGAAPWELYRYLFLLATPLALLALWGARNLPKRLGVALWLVLLPPIPAALDLVGPVDDGPRVRWPMVFGVQADEKDAFHALVRWEELADPACALVSRSRTWSVPEAPFGWTVLRPLGHRRLAEDPDLPADLGPAEVVQAIAPDTSCAVAWLSLDCRGSDDPGCVALRALEPVGPTLLATGHPFVHPDHGTAPAVPAPYGLRRIEGYDPGVPSP